MEGQGEDIGVVAKRRDVLYIYGHVNSQVSYSLLPQVSLKKEEVV